MSLITLLARHNQTHKVSQAFTVENLYENAAFYRIFSHVNHSLTIFLEVKGKVLKKKSHKQPDRSHVESVWEGCLVCRGCLYDFYIPIPVT